METEVIDIPRCPLASGMNNCQRVGCEQRFAFITGDPEPMVNVIRGLAGAKLRQSAQNRNSLAQLNQFSPGQLIRQLRLAGEQDLDQFRSGDFEVGKHAYRFEDRVVKVLRFINHDDNTPAGARFADQDFIQSALHASEIIALVRDSQISDKRAQKLARIAMGLEQKSSAGGVSQMFQKVKEQGGFPHPWFCNQGHESPLGLDPIEQRCHCFKMGGAEIKKSRIGSNPEWLLAQSEVIEEHWLYLSTVSWRGNHERNVEKSTQCDVFKTATSVAYSV